MDFYTRRMRDWAGARLVGVKPQRVALYRTLDGLVDATEALAVLGLKPSDVLSTVRATRQPSEGRTDHSVGSGARSARNVPADVARQHMHRRIDLLVNSFSKEERWCSFWSRFNESSAGFLDSADHRRIVEKVVNMLEEP